MSREGKTKDELWNAVFDFSYLKKPCTCPPCPRHNPVHSDDPNSEIKALKGFPDSVSEKF